MYDEERLKKYFEDMVKELNVEINSYSFYKKRNPNLPELDEFRYQLNEFRKEMLDRAKKILKKDFIAATQCLHCGELKEKCSCDKGDMTCHQEKDG